MEIIKSGTTLIYIEPIDDSACMTRRECEKAAVMRILIDVLGEDVALEHDAEGAPYVAGNNISISHSRKYAVVALDKDRRIGIDAEEMRPTLRRVKSRFLSEKELGYINTDDELLAAWTIKEAVYKIVGRPAVEFATAIEITPDMRHAIAEGRIFQVEAYDVGETHISVVSLRNLC